MLDSVSALVAGLGLFLSVFLLYYPRLSFSRRSLLPPGPPRLPVFGSLLHWPRGKEPWKAFCRWKQIYGDLLYFNLAGQSVLVVMSAKVVKDLFVKRGANYSDKPDTLVFAGEMVGYKKNLGLISYGDVWRKHRRYLVPEFGSHRVSQYRHVQETAARRLARDLLHDPPSFLEAIRFNVGSIIFSAVYGYSIKEKNDPFLAAGFLAMEQFGIALRPGHFLVDHLPILRHIPEWFPGAGFVKTAREFRENYDKFIWAPFKWCVECIASGQSSMPNLVSNNSKGGEAEDSNEMLAAAASDAIAGGLDTSTSSISSFLLAMVLYPNVQRRAQQELHSVVGTHRLPEMSDVPHLPYIQALMTEVLRWAPLVPLGVIHTSREDDCYDNYHIPKGTWVLPNVWHIFHDSEMFQSPDDFSPERYEGKEGDMTFVKDVAFGFGGRRSCPGRELGERTLLITIATVLSTCEILPSLDHDGQSILPDVKYTSGLISFPEPFTLRIEARCDASLLLDQIDS